MTSETTTVETIETTRTITLVGPPNWIGWLILGLGVACVLVAIAMALMHDNDKGKP